MNSRLKQFLAAENITQAQFADSIDVVRASVSHVLSGRNNPSYEFIRSMMLIYPRLNMEWLMFGKGKMYKDSEKTLREQGPLLFPESDETVMPASETVEILPDDTQEDIKVNSPDTIEIKTLDNIIQSPIKQRKVSKIIVLFDDGTFQEM